MQAQPQQNMQYEQKHALVLASTSQLAAQQTHYSTWRLVGLCPVTSAETFHCASV